MRICGIHFLIIALVQYLYSYGHYVKDYCLINEQRQVIIVL